MNLLNRQFDSCYEELIRYYPRYYLDVREMVAILKAHGAICDVLEDNIEQVYSNNFIDEMDEDSIARLESMLGIALNKSRTLEERRALVKAYFVGFGTVSASMIKETIYAYTGLEADITFEPYDDEGNNRLKIDIPLGDGDASYISDILDLISKRIPAHIMYIVDKSVYVEVDVSTLEEFILQNINIHIPIPFWGAMLMDGTALMDGSLLLDAMRSYNARVGLLYDYGDAETEQTANFVSVAMWMAIETDETAECGGELAVATSIDFWQSRYLDGSTLLDGSETFKYERQYNAAAVAIAADIDTSEDFAAGVTTTQNLHYCDGSVLMDGSTLLNSYIKKEDL
ncbi:MAG: YmfQ family protein [Clostridiales bacterium]|nr:YmfQ family protein [Clostridiales bacterium]